MADEIHDFLMDDWPAGEPPPICEFCGIVVDREEANFCESCGCWVHPHCLPDHEDECRE